MVIYLFLVFIIVVLAYMYCTERKIAEQYGMPYREEVGDAVQGG